MHEAFTLLENLTGIKKLSIRFRDTEQSPSAYTEAHFAAKFPDLLSQLKELNVYPSHDFAALEPILKHTTELEKLFVSVPYMFQPEGARFTPDHVITKTVGKQLKELRFGAQDDDLQDYDDAEYFPNSITRFSSLPDVSNKSDFPNLKKVEFGQIWIREDDDFDKLKFWLDVWRAQIAHGGWNVKLHGPLEIEWGELVELKKKGLEVSKQFLAWLDTLKGPEDDDIVFAEDMVHVWEELPIAERTEVTNFALRLFEDRGKMSVKITGEYPPTTEPHTYNVLQKVSPFMTSVTIRPQQFPITGMRLGREDAIQEAQEAFAQWTDFFKEFFPKCTSLETLRIRSDTTGDGGDIPLGKYEVELARLCRQFKLRSLDVDASALTQPETNAGNNVPYTINHEEPHMAIKHLAWISLPDPRSGYNDLKNNLLNLTHLTLHAIFLTRQTEFIWFTNIPAKLKNLVKLRVNGLVWHAGYDRQQAWIEKNPSWEDIDDDDDPFPHGAHMHAPDPLSDIGRQQPIDEQDRLMNQTLAQFFLNDFEGAMQQKLGLSPENCMQNSQYRMMIASRDAMRGELERRGRDGTMRTQLDPFLYYGHQVPPAPSGPTGNEEPADDEEGYESDAESTHSGFGVDPRFTEEIDEKLRSARLAQWVERLLVATARRTGGRCRDIKIRDVRVDGTELNPWCFRTGQPTTWVQDALGARVEPQYF
jgi:hypothetical protein